MPGQPFGVYRTSPFCLTRCGYCDFNTLHPGPAMASARPLVPARGRSSNFAAAKLTHRRCMLPCMWVRRDAIAAGGAWPRCWTWCGDHFVLAPDAEVSTEANLESTPEFFATIRAAGYTRVSLGMQSVALRALATLGLRTRRPGGGRATEARR